MSNTLLIAEDDAASRKIFREALEPDGYRIIDVSDGPSALDIIRGEHVDVLITDDLMPGMRGIELLERARTLRPDLRAIVISSHPSPDTILGALDNRACDFLPKPFQLDELRSAVRAALERNVACRVEIVSVKPDWIEIRVPCDIKAVEPIQNFLTEIEGDLPKDVREAIGSAFREMLNNAIEHGGKNDASKQVDIKYVRLSRAILYSIKDPGGGFDIGKVKHAAFANPPDEPLRHMEIREQRGIRPGGFGVLLSSQVVDELIYNEKHNEVLLVKYVDQGKDSR